MKALYRKYRPTKLSQVIGEEQVVKPLENALKQGKISHAYLFTGPRGCGKTSVARIFAHEINKFKYEIEDNYIDIIEIDAASNTGVDNIRELREKAIIAPVKGKYKVYIIDEVHMLTKSAFNALLKTLEEPPESVIFIMATTDAYKVPITITSRAQVFNFQLASPEVMQKHLESIAKSEKIDITPDALEIIVQRGGGSFRDSISLLDQISTLSDKKITKDVVLSALGLPDQELIDKLLTAYSKKDAKTITNLLKSELNNGSKPEILAENLIKTIIGDPRPELLPLLEKLPDVKNPFPEAKILLAFLGATSVTDDAARVTAGASATGDAAWGTPDESAPLGAAKLGENAAAGPVAAQPQAEKDFDQSSYLKSVTSINSALGKILEKCQLKAENSTLYITPNHKTHCIILKSTNNQQALKKFLPPGFSVEISSSDQISENSAKFDQISDIMGTVTEVNTNGNPFA